MSQKPTWGLLSCSFRPKNISQTIFFPVLYTKMFLNFFRYHLLNDNLFTDCMDRFFPSPDTARYLERKKISSSQFRQTVWINISSYTEEKKSIMWGQKRWHMVVQHRHWKQLWLQKCGGVRPWRAAFWSIGVSETGLHTAIGQNGI